MTGQDEVVTTLRLIVPDELIMDRVMTPQSGFQFAPDHRTSRSSTLPWAS